MKAKTTIRQFYQIIHHLTAVYPTSLLCKVAGVSRSGYYKWVRRRKLVTPKHQQERQLKELILQCHHEVRGTYGYYRVRAWLRRKHDLNVHHKRVYRLMRRHY